MLGLRTADGIATDRYQERHGVDLMAANRERIDLAIGEGLLRFEHGRLAPTRSGMAVADALTASFEI